MLGNVKESISGALKVSLGRRWAIDNFAKISSDHSVLAGLLLVGVAIVGLTGGRIWTRNAHQYSGEHYDAGDDAGDDKGQKPFIPRKQYPKPHG